MYDPILVLIFVWAIAMVFAHSVGHKPSTDKRPSPSGGDILTSKVAIVSQSRPPLVLGPIKCVNRREAAARERSQHER
jgi:hypothetical protein